HILEAYAGEPVEVLKLRQEFDTATPADRALEVAPGVGVLRRRVVLRGADSGQVLLYAEAVVVPERENPAVIDGLIHTDKPIGTLLAENRTETFREILAIGREAAGASASPLGVEAGDPVIARTYRIICEHRPSMLITEKFPVHFLRELPT
ncbi:MAG: chorismate--pyruvate lyase family protein, partial [Acidimicrobiales bacterium]